MFLKRTALIFSVLFLLSNRAEALTLTDKTHCNVAVQPFENNDTEGALEVMIFIKNTMEALDSIHTDNGEPGVIANLSDDGFSHIALAAVENCREKPKTTIHDSAAFVYMGLRELEFSVGGAR
jgi:hypothetical protein